MTIPVNIVTEDLIGIEEYAENLSSIEKFSDLKANIKDLLMKASRSELLLYVALRPHSATLKATPSHENPRQASFKTKGVTYAPLLPHYAGLIAEFGTAIIEKYEAELDWHYWMLDAPQTVTTYEVKIDKTLTDKTSPDPPIEALPITQANTAQTLSALFDPVPVEALEKMFPCYGKWKEWAIRASRNKLKDAREGRAKFNPYKAAIWLANKGETGFDLARCYRTLANNLPARSKDKADLLTGNTG